MAFEESEPTSADEEFLDEVFERAVALIEDGSDAEVGALLAGRDHLRSEVAALIEVARRVTPGRTEALPEVPGYAILAEIGRGGMGAVYLARQETVGGRLVALKVLPGSAATSPRAREGFLAEAHTIAGLSHPHVVTLHDVVARDGILAYAMEWVDGASLADVLDHLEPKRAGGGSYDNASAGNHLVLVRELLPAIPEAGAASWPGFVCRTVIAVARALAALHAAGLVHRDVKPSNILLRRDGTALLSDFGLVHASDGDLTRCGQFAGTIAYASPEQLEGASESLDARSDVYALGMTLYCALTLHLPFDDRRAGRRRATTPTGMLRLIEGGRAVPLREWDRRLPRDLETIVAKSIEADPARRYAGAGDLADDLERLLALQPIHARPAGWFTRLRKLVRRNLAAAWGLGIGGASALALACGVFAYAVLVPRWVEEHVREARLTLLDPEQANAIYNSTFFGREDSRLARALTARRDALRAALRSYDAALRLAPGDAVVRAERDVVAGVLATDAWSARPSGPAAADPRAAGLYAWLRGNADEATERWEAYEAQRAPEEPPDALVETGLGILYLVEEAPARAYPRLRAACQALPGVSFLTTYLADAALRCGDVQGAEKLLDLAARQPRPDSMGAAERVLADLRAAQGRDAEAERLYATTRAPGPCTLHHARFLQSRGRSAEAADAYLWLARMDPSERVRAECAEGLERWWSALPAEARLRHLREFAATTSEGPTGLLARLRVVARAMQPAPEQPVAGSIQPAQQDCLGNPPLLAALLGPRASPPLQNRSLADLARTLEVHDVSRWNLIATSSPLIRSLYAAAWRSASPGCAARRLDALVLDLRSRAPGLALGAFAMAGYAGVAGAQSCPNPPCFQGLGDLPGGQTFSEPYCLSGDGTTVGGWSGTALSADESGYPAEGFVWRADTGMVYIGDLSGGREASWVVGLTADGSTACGWASSGSAEYSDIGSYPFPEAFLWTPSGGLSGLGDLPTGVDASWAAALSDDGSVLFGLSSAATGPWSTARRAATWTSTGGWIARGTAGAWDSVFAGCSRDGQWGVGIERMTQSGPWRAIRWSDFLGLEILGEAPVAIAQAVSDGGTAVGAFGAGYMAAEWPSGGPVQILGDLPGGAEESAAYAIVRDGSLIVGRGTSGAGSEAVLWDESRGLHRVIDVLAGAGVSVPAGWLLTDARGIVRNGSVITICGVGTNPLGQTEAWIAKFDSYPTELFCFGDGSGTPCPCGNNSIVGNDDGCLSSLGVGGRLRVTGTADLGSDTLVLQGSQMPNSFALYFQGSTLANGGSGTVFGDGLRCAGGIVRLATKANSGGASQYPGPGDPSVSVRGVITAPGGWRYYQTWYRNSAAFCTTATFNLTNAARVFWVN